jgi:hypothetical protein
MELRVLSGGRWLAAVTGAVVVLGLAWAPLSAARAAIGAGDSARPGAERMSGFAGGAGGPGPGSRVALSAPCGVVSSGGHLYFTDAGPEAVSEASGVVPFSDRAELGNVVRRVNEHTGWLSTVAGIGAAGSRGDGGPAGEALLAQPCAIAIDHHGNMVLPSLGYYPQVRVIAAHSGTFYGKRMRAGNIYPVTVSRFYHLPVRGVTVDYAGNLVLSIDGFSEQGFTDPAGVFVLAARSGRFYGKQMQAGQVYRVQTDAGLSIGPLTADRAGNPVLSGGATVVIAARSGRFDGQPMRAGHAYPIAIGSSAAAVDKYGNVILAGYPRLGVAAMRSGTFYGRKMRAGQTYWLAGNLAGVQGVTTDSAGNLVLADTASRLVQVIAARPGTFYGVAMRAGHLYTVAGNGSPFSDSGDGGPATRAELAATPVYQGNPLSFTGLATDRAGNAYISDVFNNRIMMVPSRRGVYFGQPMHAGDIYTVAGTGTPGYSRQGGPARRARFDLPQGIALDRHGNLLIADYLNLALRLVAATSGTFYGIAMHAGDVYTVASRVSPLGVTADASGNLLICDAGWVDVIAAADGTFYGQAMTAGKMYQIGNPLPGDPRPRGLTLDHAGNVIVASAGLSGELIAIAARTGTFYGQHMTTGHAYQIAGGGSLTGSGIPAARARLASPQGVAADHHGNILIADSNHASTSPGLLQVLAATSGTFYGQHMTAGDIYTIAGSGTRITPDGQPATAAAILGPEGIAIEPDGDILLAETGAARIVILHP